MNKPTDEELLVRYARDSDAHIEGLRITHDAGIAHGWREAIEALRNVRPSADYWADYLTRIAKERGYITAAESLSPRAGK